jgi:Flp pilus assembly protein TadD
MPRNSAMSPELVAHHNRIYEKAKSILNGMILLEDKSSISPLFLLRRLKLTYSGWLFKRVVRLNPENWPAMWFTGKIYQRLGKGNAAFLWFERAHKINPSQPDVLREFSISAMELGRNETAIKMASEAVRIEPTDAGLCANLALAYLLNNRITDSQAAIDQALKMQPSDKASLDLQAMIKHFASERNAPPNTIPRLLSAWRWTRKRDD